MLCISKIPVVDPSVPTSFDHRNRETLDLYSFDQRAHGYDIDSFKTIRIARLAENDFNLYIVNNEILSKDKAYSYESKNIQEKAKSYGNTNQNQAFILAQMRNN